MQPIYIRDVVNVVVNGIKYDVTGTYTVPGPNSINYNELVSAISDICRIKRIIFHIPFNIAKIIVGIYESLVKNPTVRSATLNNMLVNREMNIEKNIKSFKYKPTPIYAGLKSQIKELMVK